MAKRDVSASPQHDNWRCGFNRTYLMMSATEVAPPSGIRMIPPPLRRGAKGWVVMLSEAKHLVSASVAINNVRQPNTFDCHEANASRNDRWALATAMRFLESPTILQIDAQGEIARFIERNGFVQIACSYITRFRIANLPIIHDNPREV